MLDDWFRTIELKITFEEFKRLPRTLGYKHEYYDGRCVLTPRPRDCYAVLDLTRFQRLLPADLEDDLSFRLIDDADWEPLGPLCGWAFHRMPPFDSLTDEEKDTAGHDCMAHVRGGGDGPLVSEASVIAVDDKNHPRGALLVVLKPHGYKDDPWHCNSWRQPAPPDAVVTRGGQAHLDWVFVSHRLTNRGVASAMLAITVDKLRSLGYETLTSSFFLGNGESMAWHWRNGFVLLPNPASMRIMHQKIKEEMNKKGNAGE